jgi:hypothetical protein
MVIHYVGAESESRLVTEDLGRVFVTIDDLDALMRIMGQEAGDPTGVRIYFDGGFFTEAADLKSFGEGSTGSLRIMSDAAEVSLEAARAVATGNSGAVASIQHWARMRRTKIGTGLSVASWWATATASVLLLLIPPALSSLGGSDYAEQLPFLKNFADMYGNGDKAMSAAAVLAVVVYGYWNARRARLRSGAIVRHISHDEHRQASTQNQYPRAAWIVSILALVVAVATIVVPLVTA